MSDQTSVWPPAEGATTPRVPLKHAILALSASTKINAPASYIFNIILDTSTYPEWSTFVPKVTIQSHPTTTDQTPEVTAKDSILKVGTKFTFHIKMDANSSKYNPTNLVVDDISTPDHPSDYIPSSTLASEPTYTADLESVYRVAWASDPSGLLAAGLHAHRFHEVIVRGEEMCEVRTWECMAGILTHAVKWMYKQTLENKFEECCAELKEYGEKKWAGEKGSRPLAETTSQN
jgi:hypothetical protein